MSTLEDMLKRMETDTTNYNQSLPLVDKAFAAINNDSLTIVEKKTIIDELGEQATGYEAECFCDVHSALITTTKSLEDLNALQSDED